MNVQVLLLLIILTVVGGTVTACDVNQGPVEKAGENIDNAVDDAGDALEDTGETIKEKME